MRFLIDGYNLFFKIEQNVLPLQSKRENFLEDLDREIAALNIHATLVFDSHKEQAEVFPSSRKMEALEVAFSPQNLSADQYILELLSWDSHQTTLVSSDRELASRAKHLGARVQTIEAFIAMIIRRREKKKPSPDTKPDLKESDAHLKRLLKIFKGRLDEDDKDNF